jgi:hypothetical protein
MPINKKVPAEFEFVDSGRTFHCSVEVPSRTGMTPWWWFRVDNGETARYAPFEASANDTKQSVQARIIAYYEQLLAIRARPAYQKPAWKKPERPAPAGETAPAATAPSPSLPA